MNRSRDRTQINFIQSLESQYENHGMNTSWHSFESGGTLLIHSKFQLDIETEERGGGETDVQLQTLAILPI